MDTNEILELTLKDAIARFGSLENATSLIEINSSLEEQEAKLMARCQKRFQAPELEQSVPSSPADSQQVCPSGTLPPGIYLRITACEIVHV